MKTKKKRSHFNGREWFRKTVENRTDAVLQKKNREFVTEHAEDSSRQLIVYLLECASDLNRTPNRNEIIGGKYIASRFDGWENALHEAGLPIPQKGIERKKTILYQEEYKRQEQFLMSELQERKNQKIEAQQRKEVQPETKDERLTEELIWAEEYLNRTDEELLDYVRQCAGELGHTPYRKEVLGSKYISQRFGGWYEVLSHAKLPIPKDMKEPSAKKKRKIKRRQ